MRMSGRLTDWALRGASREVAWLAGRESLAVATGFAIRSELLARRLLTGPMSAVGLTADTAERRRREHADGVRLRGPAVVLADAARPAPVVNWHVGGCGPPLLLLSGWTASGLAWPSAWLRRLEARYRVIRVDNRGTGWSRLAPAPFTIADMADDARDVLSACGFDRAVVLGVSMGGQIAQEFALRHPESVERLVLVATTPPAPARVAPAHPYPVLPFFGLLTPAHHPDEYWRTLAGFAGEDFPQELVEELAWQMLHRVTPWPMVLMQARAFSSWHGPRRLQRLSVPTLVVHGGSDPLVPPANGRRLAELIRDAEHEELPGVGHLVPQEAGDALLGLLGIDPGTPTRQRASPASSRRASA